MFLFMKRDAYNRTLFSETNFKPAAPRGKVTDGGK
jgi:hypothetical protein